VGCKLSRYSKLHALLGYLALGLTHGYIGQSVRFFPHWLLIKRVNGGELILYSFFARDYTCNPVVLESELCYRLRYRLPLTTHRVSLSPNSVRGRFVCALRCQGNQQCPALRPALQALQR
jgi:hypothetical protein